jgi:geranylgeranyl diphosphate synthase, type II
MNRNFAQYYNRLRLRVDSYLAPLVAPGVPHTLRDACGYVLTSGGKRLRAILLMLSSEAAGGTARQALPAAAAVEIMHNFTLVHDDVMDHAPSRRGAPTVHVKWDLNTALLTGDTLLAVAYRELLRTRHDNLPMLVGLFTRGVHDVCEGQAMDLAFEERNDVSVKEYFDMIARKTGRLITTSTEMGARIGGGSPRTVRALKTFGAHLGRAFQLQDDMLDVIGDERQFGKTIGGDIIEGKRTFLLLTALERAQGSDRKLVERVMQRKTGVAQRLSAAERRSLVHDVRAIYESYGVLAATRQKVAAYTRLARRSLDAVPASPACEMLHWLSLSLVHRAS